MSCATQGARTIPFSIAANEHVRRADMTQLGIDPAATGADQRSASALSSTAQRVRELSVLWWGRERAVELIGSSPAFLAMLAKVEKIARYREPVLVTGESGAGKELIAQALYLLGQPRGRPYVSVNCPQFQEGNLTVSELFGHQKGSFTGAIGDHTGAFEQAHGGAIFLDEIADLQPALRRCCCARSRRESSGQSAQPAREPSTCA